MICPVIFNIIDFNFIINVPFGKKGIMFRFSNFDSTREIQTQNYQYLIYRIWHALQDATEMLHCWGKCFMRGLQHSAWKVDQKPASKKAPVHKELQRKVIATLHLFRVLYKVCFKFEYLFSNIDKLFSMEKLFLCFFIIWKPLLWLVN